MKKLKSMAGNYFSKAGSAVQPRGSVNNIIVAAMICAFALCAPAPAAASDYVWHFTTGDNALPIQSAWSPAKGATINTTAPTITFSTNENADCKWSLTDQAYGTMVGDCTGDGTTSQSCAAAGLVEGANIVYTACRDTTLNADTIASNTHINYIVDTTLAIQSAWSPAKGATVTTTSPTITLTTNENADCKWSLVDEAYSAMAGDCTGDGTTSHSCVTAGLAEGANIVYTACRDTVLNGDTIATNEHVDYTVDTTPPSQSAWSPAISDTITTDAPTITFTTNENADCKWSLTDQAYGTMVGDCTGDGTTSQSCVTAGLAEGANIVYTACRDTSLNADTIATNEHLDYTVDTTAPTVVSVVPIDNATGVSISTTVVATFSEAMDPATVTDLTFTLMDGITPISGAVLYAGVTATFTPDSLLTDMTLYTARISGATDVAGNLLTGN